MEPNASRTVICIVDDDPSVRRALSRLVESMELRARAYASPDELLSDPAGPDVGCLLLDVQLPGMDGFELHRRLVEAGHSLPVIFITGHASPRSRDRAEQARAVAYLEKPFNDQALFDAIRIALRPEAAEGRGR